MNARPLASASHRAAPAPPPPARQAPALALVSSEPTNAELKDVVSFDCFFQRYHRRVWAFLANYLADKHLVEDLTQETLVRAYLAGLHLEAENRHWGWLKKVARNLATDAARRKRACLELPADGEGPEWVGGTEPYAALCAAWRRAGILDVLGSVPVKQARIVIAHHVEGQGYEQIAKAEGMSVEAVRSLLFRTRRTLRRRYARLARVRGLGALVPGFGYGWRSRLRSAQLRLRDLIAIPRIEFLPTAGVPAVLTGAALGGLAIAGAMAPSTGVAALDTTTVSAPNVIEIALASPVVDPSPAALTNGVPLTTPPDSDALDADTESVTPPPAIPAPPNPPADAPAPGIEGTVETETVAPIEGAPAAASAAAASDSEATGIANHAEVDVDADGDGGGDIRNDGSTAVDCRLEDRGRIANAMCPLIDAVAMAAAGAPSGGG